jgi:hypothetical protein
VRERHFRHSGRIVASCSWDVSSVTAKGGPAHDYLKRRPCSRTVFIPAEIRFDLKDNANDKVGDLTICVASSLTSPSDAVESANRAAQQLGSGLTRVNDASQGIATLATEITPAWQSLLNRLEALVKIADTVAEVRFIPNYLCPTTAKKYLQTGSPLDQGSMGSCLGSV